MAERLTFGEWAATDRIIRNLNSAVDAGLLPRSGRTITVTSSKGTVSVLDEEDQWATEIRWHEHRSGSNAYLCYSYTSSMHVFLHNHILPARPKAGAMTIDVDHIDGDSLNNRRQNLRYLSHSENISKGRQAALRAL